MAIIAAGGALFFATGRAEAAGACDGRSDATAALNAALAAGGQVRLPPGTCLISGSLHIPSGAVVSGAGIGRTFIKASPTPAYPVIAIGSDRAGASNVDLSGLTVDGSGTRVIGTEDADGVLTLPGSSRVVIHNIEVYGAGRNGIRVFGSNIEVTGTLVHDNFANGIFAVGRKAEITTDVRVLRNRVAHNSLGGVPPARSWDGIDIDPATANCLVQGNSVVGNDIILFDNGKFGTSSGGHQVLNNTIVDSVANGIDVAGFINGFKLIGNRIEHTRGFGIVVNGPVADGVIRDNTILGTTKPGIVIDNFIRLPGTPRNIEVAGNIIDPGATAGRSAAVAVRGGAANVRVVNNQVSNYGINPAGAGPGIVVQGNR